jgi:iron complex transport system permease protein
MSAVTFGALVGAVVSTLIIYVFAWSREGNSSTLLLAGVVVATVCSGFIMFIHFVGGLHKSFQLLRWLMGGVDGVSYSMFFFLVVPLTAFFIIIGLFMPQLDQFLTGDNIAHSRGVNIRVSRNMFIIVTALAVGSIVAVCGPIGFIGVIAPHAVACGFRESAPTSFGMFLFIGGSFLVVARYSGKVDSAAIRNTCWNNYGNARWAFFLIVLFRKKSRLLM